MKKLLFGLGLLLSGVVGFVGWCIAVVLTCQPGASSHVFGCFRGTEWIVLAGFMAVALAGVVIALQSVRQDDDVH